MALPQSPDRRPRVLRDAATAALGRPVTAVERRAPGIYALELGDGGTARLKLAREGRHLVEPRLLPALSDAAIPTPRLLAAVEADVSPFGDAFCIVSADGGQRLRDVLALPDAAHERLVREAGAHLAALHAANVETRPAAAGGPYADLRATDPDAPLTVVDVAPDGTPAPGHEQWPDRVGTLTDRVVTRLRESEFDHLAATVRRGVAAADLPDRPPVATLHLDYRPRNLTFAPGVTWPSHARRESDVVRTVRGFGTPATGDGLLDLAIAEEALVGLPLGGTDRATALTAALREAYVEERGGSTPFGERYAAYLLLARGRLLGTTENVHRRTHEHDARAVERRCRKRVRELTDRLR